MTLRLFMVALVLSTLACEAETDPVTQIMLRVHASVEVQAQAARYRLLVNGQSVLGDRMTSEIAHWPVDVPIVAGKNAGGQQELVFEVLDADGKILAQDRAITELVLREVRLLELHLTFCTSTEPVCESEDCRGPSCQHCVDGACVAVGVTPGESLPPLDPTVAIVPDEAPRCPAQPVRCRGNAVEQCQEGRWTAQTVCAHACVEGQCAGVCSPGQDPPRCTGRTPEICNAQGAWETDRNAVHEKEECEFLCVDGACGGECTPRDTRCSEQVQRQCGTDAMWHDERQCDQFCSKKGCQDAPSCQGGLRCADNMSCCSAIYVQGGTFLRSYDGADFTDQSAPATVSALIVDRFEVTVGRFRRWVQVYDQPGAKPAAGAGNNTRNSADTGWSSTWDGQLPANAAALRQSLVGCEGTTWSESTGDERAERLPINCVSWYMAQAFCIWDRARLPTEAEWNYVAAAGDQQRVYPWSTPPQNQSVDATRLVVANPPDDVPTAPLPVGSKPAGNSLWGHADLSGNVAEWVIDWRADPYPVGSCVDCANLTTSALRVTRGGSFALNARVATASFRSSNPPDLQLAMGGIRCVREP